MCGSAWGKREIPAIYFKKVKWLFQKSAPERLAIWVYDVELTDKGIEGRAANSPKEKSLFQ